MRDPADGRRTCEGGFSVPRKGKSPGAAGVAFVHAAYGFGTVPEGTPAIRDIRELPAAAEAFFGLDKERAER